MCKKIERDSIKRHELAQVCSWVCFQIIVCVINDTGSHLQRLNLCKAHLQFYINCELVNYVPELCFEMAAPLKPLIYLKGAWEH